ncbi:MAG: hypothetical protein GY793_01050 [Proteobacteria bacterium]|nr:hypothetical protein [Pseudomonadota bacterium]
MKETYVVRIQRTSEQVAKDLVNEMTEQNFFPSVMHKGRELTAEELLDFRKNQYPLLLCCNNREHFLKGKEFCLLSDLIMEIQERSFRVQIDRKHGFQVVNDFSIPIIIRNDMFNMSLPVSEYDDLIYYPQEGVNKRESLDNMVEIFSYHAKKIFETAKGKTILANNLENQDFFAVTDGRYLASYPSFKRIVNEKMGRANQSKSFR